MANNAVTDFFAKGNAMLKARVGLRDATTIYKSRPMFVRAGIRVKSLFTKSHPLDEPRADYAGAKHKFAGAQDVFKLFVDSELALIETRLASNVMTATKYGKSLRAELKAVKDPDNIEIVRVEVNVSLSPEAEQSLGRMFENLRYDFLHNPRVAVETIKALTTALKEASSANPNIYFILDPETERMAMSIHRRVAQSDAEFIKIGVEMEAACWGYRY